MKWLTLKFDFSRVVWYNGFMNKEITNPYGETEPNSLEKLSVGKITIENAKGDTVTITDEQYGLTWDDWLECVQFMVPRYTSGDDTPAEWGEVKLKTMFSDLQVFPRKAVEHAITKLHQDGRLYAPNSSQIIGMINKLGYKSVPSYKDTFSDTVGVCLYGGEHLWANIGWFSDERGEYQYIQQCVKRNVADNPICGEEQVNNVVGEDYIALKPDKPMTKEVMINTMKKLKLDKDMQTEIMKLIAKYPKDDEEVKKRSGRK